MKATIEVTPEEFLMLIELLQGVKDSNAGLRRVIRAALTQARSELA